MDSIALADALVVCIRPWCCFCVLHIYEGIYVTESSNIATAAASVMVESAIGCLTLLPVSFPFWLKVAVWTCLRCPTVFHMILKSEEEVEEKEVT